VVAEAAAVLEMNVSNLMNVQLTKFNAVDNKLKR